MDSNHHSWIWNPESCHWTSEIQLAVYLGIEPSSFSVNSGAHTPCVLVHKKLWEGSWWGWLDSNQLNVEVTDLQSAVPHQLHRIPIAGMDQYRQLFGDVGVELVCVTGIEPAASRSQSACSTC